MNLVLMVTISGLVSLGVLLLLSRDAFRLVMGLTVLGTAANLVLFFSGRPGSLTAPIIAADASSLTAGAASPLPQALVLTAIVIGFSLLCFALLLTLRLSQQQSHMDVSRYHSSEPLNGNGGDLYQPPILEDK